MRKIVLTPARLLALFSSAARARRQMEIIDLKSRTADPVLPYLRPFVEPGGTVQERAGEEYGTSRNSSRGASSARGAQLKVDELP